jgi:hypothetical protein
LDPNLDVKVASGTAAGGGNGGGLDKKKVASVQMPAGVSGATTEVVSTDASLEESPNSAAMPYAFNDLLIDKFIELLEKRSVEDNQTVTTLVLPTAALIKDCNLHEVISLKELKQKGLIGPLTALFFIGKTDKHNPNDHTPHLFWLYEVLLKERIIFVHDTMSHWHIHQHETEILKNLLLVNFPGQTFSYTCVDAKVRPTMIIRDAYDSGPVVCEFVKRRYEGVNMDGLSLKLSKDDISRIRANIFQSIQRNSVGPYEVKLMFS